MSGSHFVKFVEKYRIETAKRLLASGRTTKDEVAYQVGFSDAKYFWQSVPGGCGSERGRVCAGIYLWRRLVYFSYVLY